MNTIGFLVFSNLTINNTDNGFTLTNKSGQVDLNMGTFPTTKGAQQLADLSNTIKNGDVVYLQSTEPAKNRYLSFQKNSNVKVPTLQPNPSNTCLWQIVKLSKDGYTIIPETGNAEKDSIRYGEIVGFYAYNCSGTPNTLCGWMSSNPGTCNCTPYMSTKGHGCCETWYFSGKNSGYVYDKESPIIQCSITQPCPLCSKNNDYLSQRSFFQDPPTLQSPSTKPVDAWQISKVYSQKPLPN